MFHIGTAGLYLRLNRISVKGFQPDVSQARAPTSEYLAGKASKPYIHAAGADPCADNPYPTRPAMSIIVPKETSRSSTVARETPAQRSTGQLDAWRILGWVGLAYLIMSLIDLALGWYPVSFGSSEWEFGTISATMAGLAIPTLALYLILGSALAADRTNVARITGFAMILLAVSIAVLCAIYLTSVPIALKAVESNPTVHLGLEKAIIKSLMLFAGYETLYILGAMRALRRRPRV